MNSGDDRPTNGRAADHYYIVSDDEINRIVVPLTVVHAYIQLLRRRIGNNTLGGADELDEALARMHDATRTMTTDLWTIMKATTHP